MVQARKPLFEFVIRHRLSKFNLNDLESRVAATRAAAAVIADLVDPALKSAYTRQLADWVSLDVSEVSSIVAGVSRNSVADRVAPLSKTPVTPPRQDDPQSRHERQVLEIMVQHPNFFKPLEIRRIAAAGFTNAEYQKLISVMARSLDSIGEPDWVTVLMQQDVELVESIRALAMAELPVRNQGELERYARGIVKAALISARGRCTTSAGAYEVGARTQITYVAADFSAKV
jgi:DNA primase